MWKPPFLRLSNERMIFLGQYLETLLMPAGHPAEDGRGARRRQRHFGAPSPWSWDAAMDAAALAGGSLGPPPSSLVCLAWDHSTAEA